MLCASSACHPPRLWAWTRSARASSLGGPLRSSSTASAAIVAGRVGGVGEQERRGEGREQLSAVDGGALGRQGREPRPQHLHRLGHPPGGDQRLGAPAGQREGVDVGQRLAGGVDQLERVEEVGRRLRGAADGQRLLARLDGGADGDRAVVGAAGVLRELGRRADGPALPQRGDEGGVEPHPLAGQQVVVDRLAEQRVPEGVGAAARGHQDVGRRPRCAARPRARRSRGRRRRPAGCG